MILGSGQLSFSLRVAAVVMPVAVYFLILGVLNSRRHPQLLRSRRDFLLLMAALCPLFVLPALQWLQDSWPALAVLAAAGVCGAGLLAPAGPAWVIYNITPAEARSAMARALRAAGLEFSREGDTFRLAGDGATVQVSDFPLLRNVSIRLLGGGGGQPRRLEEALASTLRTIPAETTPATMALLLVATAMLAAPLALVAPQAGEIVRILTGMLY